MKKLVEPLLYIIGFALIIQLLIRLKYAPLVLLSVVDEGITIWQRLYLLGLITLWVILFIMAILLLRNATRIGIKFYDNIKK
ncbi:MAG: hypothetical protein ED556_09000 [Winogradskyella sp.]|uniref:hypothetical protein n=1 Tax=Winogradskyella sp. TaxID=1883156 RepID=UPI000F3EBCBE|nr:hypothetical protein [Winogradskyella sp.]RNC86417.1 MAG: hypothetical protein ED556_09000 [Winogradskyella sp.]